MTATFEATGRGAAGAVDGTTVNEPFWGTAGSPNATDSLEVELDGTQTVDDVRLYFYRSSSTATVQGYAAPELYTLEYHDAAGWHPVTGQARTPVYSTANLNHVQLPAVAGGPAARDGQARRGLPHGSEGDPGVRDGRRGAAVDQRRTEGHRVPGPGVRPAGPGAPHRVGHGRRAAGRHADQRLDRRQRPGRRRGRHREPRVGDNRRAVRHHRAVRPAPHGVGRRAEHRHATSWSTPW